MADQQQATGARERAARAKDRELAAHLAAVELHEQAAEMQQRLKCDDRARAAQQRAEHARSLHELALVEQAEQEAFWEAHEPPDAGRKQANVP